MDKLLSTESGVSDSGGYYYYYYLSVDNSCSSLIQKFLSNKIENFQFRKLFHNFTPIDRARLLSISSPHASARLSVTPSPTG